MKKFSFRLQKLMDLRKALQERALEQFAIEQKKLLMEQQKLELFNREAESHLETMRTEIGEPFKVWTQSVNHRYTKRIKNIMEFQTQRIDAQSELVTQANDKYLEARRDLKVVEKLKEKKLDEWKLATSRAEENLMDDFNSTLYPGGD